MTTTTEADLTPLDYFDKRAGALGEALQRAGLPDSALAGRLVGALRQSLAAGDPAPLLAVAGLWHAGAPTGLGQLLRRSAFDALRPAEGELAAGWALLEHISDLIERAAARSDTMVGQTSELQTFKALVDNALDGIALLSLEGQVLYANAAFSQLSGAGEQLLGSSIRDYFDQGERERIADDVDRALAQAGRWQGEVRCRRPDSTVWVAQVSAFAISNLAGTPVNRALIARDITEQHEQQQGLRFFRALAENAPYSIGIADLSFRELYANPAYHAMLGYAPGAMIGMDARTFLAGGTTGEGWEHLKLHGWWHGVLAMRHAQGNILHTDGAMFLIPDEQGRPCAIGGVMRDVSAELAAQTQLQLTKERLEQMFETMPLAAIELDNEGTTVSWNSSAERLFGWQAQEVIGKSGATFIMSDLPPAQAHEAMMSALTRSSDRLQQHTNYTKDGRALVCRWYSNAIRDGQGQVVGYLGLAEDITELVQREGERQRLQDQIIIMQREALRELSTPLIPVADDVVVMPLIGSIDSGRAQQVIEALLGGVAATHARMAILDITGVSVVDSQVANALLRAAQAVKLLGAQTVLTGIRPEVAQTLTGLGVDMGQIITRGTLQSGIAFALRVQDGKR